MARAHYVPNLGASCNGSLTGASRMGAWGDLAAQLAQQSKRIPKSTQSNKSNQKTPKCWTEGFALMTRWPQSDLTWLAWSYKVCLAVLVWCSRMRYGSGKPDHTKPYHVTWNQTNQHDIRENTYANYINPMRDTSRVNENQSYQQTRANPTRTPTTSRHTNSTKPSQMTSSAS